MFSSFAKPKAKSPLRLPAMSRRLVLGAAVFSATFLCAAVAYTWPAIPYSPPNSCGRNATFDQNSFVCLACGADGRPRPTGYGCECREDHWVVQGGVFDRHFSPLKSPEFT